MEAIYQWMKNIVYFLLFVGVMRNLTGKEYQKYASLSVGICLVLLVASPLMNYIAGDELQDNFLHYFQGSEWEGNLAWEGISGDEEAWKEEVLSQYCRRIQEQTGELLKKRGLIVTRVELQMEEDRVVTGMMVWVAGGTSGKEISGQGAGQGIQPISITDIVIRLDSEEGGQEGGSKAETKRSDPMETQLLKLDIKTELADFYDMDASHINIIIS